MYWGVVGDVIEWFVHLSRVGRERVTVLHLDFLVHDSLSLFTRKNHPPFLSHAFPDS